MLQNTTYLKIYLKNIYDILYCMYAYYEKSITMHRNLVPIEKKIMAKKFSTSPVNILSTLSKTLRGEMPLVFCK